jgi:cyanophycin synthetase
MKISERTSTGVIVREANKRGIQVHTFRCTVPFLVLLEYRGHREYIVSSGTSKLDYMSYRILRHKGLTNEVLRRGGFPVPDEVVTADRTEIARFLEKHKQIVIKPLDLTWGIGVTPGITKRDQIDPALQYVRSLDSQRNEELVVCQQHVTGEEYRILVVANKYVYASRRIPAHVRGDGVHTVRELIEQWNAKVQKDRQLHTNDRMEKVLESQELGFDAVPPKGETVWLSRVANAHAGGTVHDATEQIGRAVTERALDVAAYFKMPLVGIDCITNDIEKDIGYIIELNSTPDLTLHHFPTSGTPRNVATKIVDMLFPETVA